MVPYRLNKDKPIADAFFDIKLNYDHVLISGGDGTIDLIVNTMKELDIDIPIGILPSGTANDFAKAVNLSFDSRQCIERIIKSKPKKIDIGKINNKYFINVASAGMFTDVSQKINPELKNSMGKVSYYLKGIEETLYMREFSIKVTSKEVVYDGNMYLMLIFNGKTAGNFNLATRADATDGMLDVIIFKAVQVYELIPLFIKVLKGEHLDSDKVIYFKTDRLHIECNEDIVTDIDGEKGPDFPLDIKCIKGGLKILGVK